MYVANKNRFPRLYGLDELGGEKSADGEKYYKEHEKELNEEYTFYWNESIERFKFGDNKKIHYGTDR
jgi:hypothetical protein